MGNLFFMALDVIVIYGSVRSTRQGIKAAKFVVNTFKKRGHTVTLVDPLETKLPLIDKLYREYEKGKAPKVLEDLAGLFRKADAFVIVSGEYNHSIPPALTNLLDHFRVEYFFRPSGIVCYSVGPFGGVRAAMQLRALLGELGMSSIPTIFAIPGVHSSFNEEGIDLKNIYSDSVKRFLDELEWYANALKEARNKGIPY